MDIRCTKLKNDLIQCAELMTKSEPWITLKFDLEKCIMSLHGEYKEIYIAKIDGLFVGFVIIQFYGVLQGYIQTICVKSEYRNMGIGSSLLKYSEKRINEKSPNVFLCVSSFNLKAQKLYFKLGFEKIGVLSNHIVPGCDELILRKSLAPLSEY